MDQANYRNLRFERRPRSVPVPLIVVGITSAAFTLAWIVIPHGALYWLMLLLLGGLAWAASYGWRRALSNLIAALRRLEES